MSVALFCPMWAYGGGIFSSDPVTMETGYIGHGNEFIPNFSALALDGNLLFFLFWGFFWDVKCIILKSTLITSTWLSFEFYLACKLQLLQHLYERELCLSCQRV